MKLTSLIPTVLLTLSLAGATQAHSSGPANRHIAAATIELAHCEAAGSAHCSISNVASVGDSAAAVKGVDHADLTALPPANPQHQAAELAAPVPEPQTFVMMMLGLVVLGFASRRRSASEKFSD